jgi:hypothetical protein
MVAAGDPSCSLFYPSWRTKATTPHVQGCGYTFSGLCLRLCCALKVSPGFFYEILLQPVSALLLLDEPGCRRGSTSHYSR